MADVALFIQGPGDESVVYSADDLRVLITTLLGPGVIGEFAVTERGAGANMSVDATDLLVVVEGTDTAQGRYLCRIDGRNLSIGAAPGGAGTTRHDLICGAVLDDTAGGPSGQHKPDLVVVAGTASSSPVDPTPPPSHEILYRVRVPFGTSSITDALIDPLFEQATLSPLLKIDGANLAPGSVDNSHIVSVDAAKVTTGTLGVDRIPSLGAGKITSGAFHVDRIPNLDAAKITTGTLPLDRGGTGAATAAAALASIGAYGPWATAPAGRRIAVQSSSPGTPSNGDIWFRVP